MEPDEVAPFRLGLILPQSTLEPAWTGPAQIQSPAVNIPSAEIALNIDPPLESPLYVYRYLKFEFIPMIERSIQTFQELSYGKGP
jgi:hypothetical protein